MNPNDPKQILASEDSGLSNVDHRVGGADYTPALPDGATYLGRSARVPEEAWQI